MHELFPETKEDFVAVRVTGRITAEDFESVALILEHAIARQGKIALFWEMRGFEGGTVGGLWADTKFDARHANNLTRIAMVGETKWQEWMTGLIKPFTSAAVRYFDEADRPAALEWARAEAVRANSNHPPSGEGISR